MFRNIRWRIGIPYIALILLIMAGLAIYLSTLVRQAQLDDLRASLLSQARAITENIRPSLGQENENLLDSRAKAWAELLGARVTIIGPDGTVLGESHEERQQMENHLSRPEVQAALAEGAGSSIRYSQTVGYDMLYAAVPVQVDGELAGFVRVALPLRQIATNINQLQRAILAAAAFAALLAGLMAVVIAERTAQPLRRLTRVAQRMSAGDLDARLYLASQDEIGELTRAFNDMADRLREQVNSLDSERARLAAILEHMADGVLITDSAGRVSLINPAAARLLGSAKLARDLSHSIGRSFAEVARHHQLIDLWNRSCRDGGEQVASVELDRQGTFLQMIVTPLQTAAGEAACLIILQDLTRIRRLETVRRDFISNLSHELRTPLAALKALVETLRDGALEDPPAARRFLDRAEEETDALSQMVQELLELSRIESGKVPLRLAPRPVADVILPAVERLRPQAERGRQNLAVELSPDLPPVLADAERVRQVVSNLLHNAIKFTPAGGQITISAGRAADGKTIQIAVRDSGPGIPADELERIFERFYKADRARSGGGTGLGLAIARHLVNAHGGRIWAKSKEGQGSTFTFTLPTAL